MRLVYTIYFLLRETYNKTLQVLYSNLPLPSISTVQQNMKNNDNKIVEGQLRMSELKDFLVSNNLPLKAWISEDGTRILDKVEYDPQTNQLVGLVLPLEKDAMPKVLSHEADCARNIESLILNKEKSKIGYIV
jgi:hypothetical protein